MLSGGELLPSDGVGSPQRKAALIMKIKKSTMARVVFAVMMAAAFLLVCACSRSGEGEIHDIGIGSMNGPNGSYEPKYPIVTDDPNSATVKLDENYTMPVNTTEVIDLGDGEAAITWPEEWNDFFGITPDPNATGTPEPTETAVPATTAPAETGSSTPEPTATPEGPTPEPTIDDGEGDWFGDF